MKASDVTVFRCNFSIVMDRLSPSEQGRCVSVVTGITVDFLEGGEVPEAMAPVTNKCDDCA